MNRENQQNNIQNNQILRNNMQGQLNNNQEAPMGQNSNQTVVSNPQQLWQPNNQPPLPGSLQGHNPGWVNYPSVGPHPTGAPHLQGPTGFQPQAFQGQFQGGWGGQAQGAQPSPQTGIFNPQLFMNQSPNFPQQSGAGQINQGGVASQQSFPGPGMFGGPSLTSNQAQQLGIHPSQVRAPIGHPPGGFGGPFTPQQQFGPKQFNSMPNAAYFWNQGQNFHQQPLQNDPRQQQAGLLGALGESKVPTNKESDRRRLSSGQKGGLDLSKKSQIPVNRTRKDSNRNDNQSSAQDSRGDQGNLTHQSFQGDNQNYHGGRNSNNSFRKQSWGQSSGQKDSQYRPKYGRDDSQDEYERDQGRKRGKAPITERIRRTNNQRRPWQESRNNQAGKPQRGSGMGNNSNEYFYNNQNQHFQSDRHYHQGAQNRRDSYESSEDSNGLQKTRSIFINDMPLSLKIGDIYHIFSQFGKVDHIEIQKKKTRKLKLVKNMVTIRFDRSRSAREAVEKGVVIDLVELGRAPYENIDIQRGQFLDSNGCLHVSPTLFIPKKQLKIINKARADKQLKEKIKRENERIRINEELRYIRKDLADENLGSNELHQQFAGYEDYSGKIRLAVHQKFRANLTTFRPKNLQGRTSSMRENSKPSWRFAS